MKMIFKRQIETSIRKWIHKGKIIIIYGPRQVGKTTLVQTLLADYGTPKDYYNCEILGVRQAIEQYNPQRLKTLFGNTKMVVLDEAQKVRDIGTILKMFHDAYPEIQIIASGSSSFDLANKVSESLTGRALEFTLFPLSLAELSQQYSRIDLGARLETVLRYGMYPEIVNSSEQDARVLLDNLTSKYLFQDVLAYEQIKKSNLLVTLLQLLALQLGNEVSLHELAVTLATNRKTIERYLDLLEKSFVIFRLRSFSRNLRKEIAKKQKIYFYDLGIRNSLIARYNPLAVRDDVGGLWENLCIMERMKYIRYNQLSCNMYFWRTHDQKEIDYIEESNSVLHGYELKWNKKTIKVPRLFTQTYPGSSVDLINNTNFDSFLL